MGGHRVSRGGDQLDASLGAMALPPRISTINISWNLFHDTESISYSGFQVIRTTSIYEE